MNQYVWLGLAVLLAVSHVFAFRQGGLEARKDEAQHAAQLLEAEKRFTSEALARAIAAEDHLQAVLNAPKAAPQVKTVIRENPANCVVPKPVDDQLRKSRGEANARIRGSLGSR